MVGLNRDFGTAIVLITHDLGVVAEVCQRVVVMYAGKVVEEASAQDLFTSPQHPYTVGLLSSIPVLGDSVKEKLVPIGGLPPDLLNPPEGCRFAPRCSRRQAKCAEPPPLAPVGKNRKAACWFPGSSNETARPLAEVAAS
jgi:oligopeptide/dipeptide ABC transporter ATP-binding protein